MTLWRVQEAWKMLLTRMRAYKHSGPTTPTHRWEAPDWVATLDSLWQLCTALAIHCDNGKIWCVLEGLARPVG